MQKLIKTALLLVFAFAILGCKSKELSSGDDTSASIASSGGNQAYYSAVVETFKTQPSEALSLIEKGESTGMLSWVQAHELKYRAYSKLGYDSQALLALNEFTSDPAFNQLPEKVQLQFLLDKVKSNIKLSRYDVALDEAHGLVRRARNLGDPVLLADVDMQISAIYAFQNLPKDSREYSNFAYERLKSANVGKDLMSLSSVISTSLDNCIYTKTYTRCDWLLDEWKSAITKLRTRNEVPAEQVDEQEAAYLAKAAYIYQVEGRHGDAEKSYQLFKELEANTSISSPDEIVRYLMGKGDYKEALKLIPTLESYGVDTVRMGYVNNLADRARIALNTGDTLRAIKYHMRSDDLKDSISVRNIAAATIEAESLLGYEKQTEELARSQKTVRSQQLALGLAAGVLVVLLALIPFYIITIRNIRKRNEFAAQQIDDQVLYTQKLAKVRAELEEANARTEIMEMKYEEKGGTESAIKESLAPRTSEDEENIRQFVAMDKILEDKKLYLDPDFNRAQLEAETGVQRDLASKLIKSNTGYNFAVYVNEKRLKHSVELLRDYNNYTIEAVALDSGFGEVRSFYRVFREKFGMTPTAYRETVMRKGTTN